ncbi:hypothetical protein ET875_18225 [Salmonella enterica subsp. enterica serovar Montevideo]|uniref:Bacteriocin n=1 Tax=Salmonella enterica subsp. salamae TaxID=59202 RepID=A0A5Y3MYM1_SALER|nr:hypothetical protein [Salmonella enterica]EBQ9004932.1 hypothetical protein [Salmonella enterica subsp. enterica serovar Blockley]ECA9146158.1 hypothetical protein [Salmonella enterica subsp. enterica serovar Montevideo]ECI4011660.1 hypothetical protein [Salmonella enterica subsp. salamae]ECU7995235.1 hypothetical protein [Salmonella enterica subsp. enterica serovar Toucra]
MRPISDTELSMISGAGEFSYGELAGVVAGGAVAGAMGGAVIGGLGAGPGAIAGATTAGAAYVAGSLVQSFFGNNSSATSSSGAGS